MNFLTNAESMQTLALSLMTLLLFITVLVQLKTKAPGWALTSVLTSLGIYALILKIFEVYSG